MRPRACAIPCTLIRRVASHVVSSAVLSAAAGAKSAVEVACSEASG